MRNKRYRCVTEEYNFAKVAIADYGSIAWLECSVEGESYFMSRDGGSSNAAGLALGTLGAVAVAADIVVSGGIGTMTSSAVTTVVSNNVSAGAVAAVSNSASVIEKAHLVHGVLKTGSH